MGKFIFKVAKLASVAGAGFAVGFYWTAFSDAFGPNGEPLFDFGRDEE